jgi:CHAT domain-containing protein
MVDAEVRVVEELGNFVTSLVGQAATRDTVANSPKDHPWVHFACHDEENEKGERDELGVMGQLCSYRCLSGVHDNDLCTSR